MHVRATRGAVTDIAALRPLYLRELNAQMRYDSVHPRGWSDVYLLHAGDDIVGYGAVMSQDQVRDTIFEWFVLPPWRDLGIELFAALISTSGATLIESQTNDPCLYPMARHWGVDLRPTVYFFEAGPIADLSGPGTVRPRADGDTPMTPDGELGSHVLEVDGEIVASGGFLLHYNHPFADVYMDVHEAHRRRGYGARIVASVMRACWLAGRIPAARCNVDNAASRATLRKAGMREIGRMMFGALDPSRSAETAHTAR